MTVTQASGDCEINLNSLNSPVGYLTSILKDQTSCGSIENPWVFTGMREQSIQFNLYNFSGGGSTGNQAAKETCTVYLTIKERELHEYYTVCQSNKRQSAVYSSKSSHVEIRIHQRENEYFLVKFEGRLVFEICLQNVAREHMYHVSDLCDLVVSKLKEK